jgi:hypothetical protein
MHVIAKYNKNKTLSQKNHGQPKKELNCNIVELIRSLIISANISDAHFQYIYYDKNLKKMTIYSQLPL